ncbi:hypothetical protein [Aurantiacibacter aquimixticola]|uniref:Uncharacterized protein n=1 Tax=Aurantiacibacter aquimixticola TaxID=1958945 RepID=A0A419RS03_9SPHN|nr:hypothetical protein [Aurantiacibacter aquimixticola]RJY08560.1 hypothetical protein D6201_03555 [Aurantiacibacter aquimixticola]
MSERRTSGDQLHDDAINASNASVTTLAASRSAVRDLASMPDRSLCNDELVARVAGMKASLISEASELEWRAGLHDFLHAMAFEGQLIERLREGSHIDSETPPLLTERAAMTDDNIAAAASDALLAQRQFVREQRAMTIAIAEVPYDLVASDGHESADEDDAVPLSRLQILAEIAETLDTEALAYLDLRNAGVSLFASALAIATDTSREEVLFAMADSQTTQLLALLESAGLSSDDALEQLNLLHPDRAYMNIGEAG